MGKHEARLPCNPLLLGPSLFRDRANVTKSGLLYVEVHKNAVFGDKLGTVWPLSYSLSRPSSWPSFRENGFHTTEVVVPGFGPLRHRQMDRNIAYFV